MPTIITRAQWGFDGWLDPKDPPNTVNEKTQRTEFFTHYNGPPTRYRTGTVVPRIVHDIHKGNGWKGIGYGHVVDNAGTIYEGRGFNLQGSHCPNHNVSGYSAMGDIGEGETPSAAMLASIRWLYEEAQRRTGKALTKKGHRDGTATACPGDVLYRWVRNGMPATTAPALEEDDMPLTTEDIQKIATEVFTRPVYDSDGNMLTVGQAIGLTLRNSTRAAVDATVARKLAEEAAALGRPLTVDEIAAAAKQGSAEALDAKIADATTILGVKQEQS